MVDFVPDLRSYIAKAYLCGCTDYSWCRVSNKLGEAAVGTSVVATRLACGDMPVRDEEHLLLADQPSAFADRVVDLLAQSGTAKPPRYPG